MPQRAVLLVSSDKSLPRPSADFEAIAQNLRVERELLHLCRWLEGVPFAVFKGPLLTRRLYGDLRSRSSRDNDILVHESDGTPALQLLLAQGYVPSQSGLDPVRALREAGQVSLSLPDAPHRPSVDLHIRAFSNHFFRVKEELLWESLVTVRVQDQEVLTFNDELMFCHLVAHYIQHLFEPDLLPELRRGVEVFGRHADDTRLRFFVERTVGARAADFATGMAGVPWRDSERSLGSTIANALRKAPLPKPTVLRGAVALLVSDPACWGGAIRDAFVPSRDELESRYGSLPLTVLVAKHWAYRLGVHRLGPR